MRTCFLFSDLILKITWFYFICLKSCFSTLLTRPWSVSPSAAASRLNAGDGRRSCPPLTLASHPRPNISVPWPLPPATAVLFPFPVFLTGTLMHEHQRCLPSKGQQSTGGIPVSSNLELARHFPWSLAIHLWKPKQAHQTTVETAFLWREERF